MLSNSLASVSKRAILEEEGMRLLAADALFCAATGYADRLHILLKQVVGDLSHRSGAVWVPDEIRDPRGIADLSRRAGRHSRAFTPKVEAAFEGMFVAPLRKIGVYSVASTLDVHVGRVALVGVFFDRVSRALNEGEL